MKEKKRTLKNGSGTKISLLVNSLYFFIECVFIEVVEENCRLIAIHQGQLIVNRQFKSLKGARISFARSFRPQLWQKDIKPQWTQIYPPDEDWLQEKWQILEERRPGTNSFC